MSVLIFEGADCVGKTSLIEQYVKLLPENSVIVKHFSYPPKILINKNDQHDYCQIEYFNELNFHKRFSNITFIYDRYYLGEQVYAPIFRGYSPNYINELEQKLNEESAILILVTASPETVKKRFDGNFIKMENIEELLNRYEIIFKNSKIKNKIIINTDFESPVILAQKLKYQLGGEI